MPDVQSQQEANDAVLALVKATWEATPEVAGAPLYYDNKSVSRPSEPSLFGRTVIRQFGSGRASIGNSGSNSVINRRRGSVFVQIFIPQGEGTSTITAIAEAMQQAFEDADETLGVRLTDPDSRTLGSDGTYYQVNVEANLSYDRIS